MNEQNVFQLQDTLGKKNKRGDLGMNKKQAVSGTVTHYEKGT